MGLFGTKKKGKHADNSDYIPEGTSGLKDPSFIHTAPYALTADEVLGNTSTPKRKTQDISMTGGTSPLEALIKRVKSNAKPSTDKNETVVSKTETVVPSGTVSVKKVDDGKSLLDKCMPYINEGGGVVGEDKPAYTLESIESIISTSELKAAKLLEQLSNVGTVTYDSLKKGDSIEIAEKVEKKNEVKVSTDTIVMAKVNDDTKIRKISDIDAADGATDKTITFDSVASTEKMEDITSGTRIIDLSTEMFDSKAPENSTLLVNPFMLEDENFAVDDDYMSFQDAKRIGGGLISKLKGARIRAVITFLLLLVMALPLLPSIHDKLYVNQSFFGIISAAVFAVVCLVNYDAFLSIPSLFRRQHIAESVTGVLGVSAIVYAVTALLTNKNPYSVLLFVAVNFMFKCVAVCMRAATVLGNFRIVASRNKKMALEFIDDRQITFAMAKNSVEGDVLVGIDSPCINVLDFIRNTEIDKVSNRNFSLFALIASVCSAALGVFYGVYTESLHGFFMAFTVFLGLAFAPTLLFTDILPLRAASKKLNKKGAMITGSTAAKKIELANAVTVRSRDLFPDGTITLFNIQALDSNRMDETLLFAAALTKQIGSPYESIFADIAASSGGKIPEADSVKYEERLGISGWVGNRHVFIGNRTLLEAHGIKTPSFEIDKKILRNGYFPVYVASDEKPCALLMVKYNVKTSIANELQKLCSTGVTLLVNTCDPNITSEMVCDYFGLYEESVYVMGGSGAQLYQNNAKMKDDISSYAAHRGNCEAFLSIFNCAAKIKRGISTLRFFHNISWIVTAAVYIYSSYLNGLSPIDSGTAYLYIGISFAISIIIHLFNKP